MAIGTFGTAVHGFTSYLQDGRSLHPLQRNGMVGHSGYANIGIPTFNAVSSAPPAAPTHLGLPPVMTIGHTALPNVRV
jgi:hypothetical protein